MKKNTEIWWKTCLDSPEKLEHWLIALYNNEKDAEFRFKEFAELYCKNDIESYNIFHTIAEQEKNHAILVEKIIQNRGLTLYDKSSKDGRYWRNTLPCVIDKITAAAIGAYAEGLSLKRMRVIIKDTNTPTDLKELFQTIEPEESFHAKTLEQIATKYGMKKVKDCHDKGLEELGLLIKK